jgi:hypothetical protein
MYFGGGLGTTPTTLPPISSYRTGPSGIVYTPANQPITPVQPISPTYTAPHQVTTVASPPAGGGQVAGGNPSAFSSLMYLTPVENALAAPVQIGTMSIATWELLAVVGAVVLVAAVIASAR